MKRILPLLLSAALLLALLPACQGPAAESEPPVDQEPTALEVVDAVFPSSGFDGGADAEYLTTEDEELLTAYLENAYGLAAGTWEDAAVIRATGASSFELAVLRMADEDAAVRAASGLMSYIFSRQGDFAGYAPAQADMVANGSINQDGPYAALFICPDPAGADRAFTAAVNGGSLPPRPDDGPQATAEAGAVRDPDPVPTEIGSGSEYPGRVKFVQPNKDDMSLYDTTAIRAAWAADDPSGLSDYDGDIYDAAKQVLDQVLEDGMSDLEKETAIYNWVVHNVDYDWTHQNILLPTPRESFTPYGGLVNHTAVCLGYAATFQLLCDLAGVECITVVGAAFGSREDHAWNMVRLNGNWYCLDVTWDANYREQLELDWPEEYWNHFNVTSDMMAAEDHQWDYANTPEAVTEGNGRG